MIQAHATPGTAPGIEADEPTRRVEAKKKGNGAAADSPATPQKSIHALFSQVTLGENVRKIVDQRSVDELATSIKEVGLIQAPVARSWGTAAEPAYKIVVGQRRFLALQKLHAEEPSRYPTIELILTTASDAELPLVQLAENLGRADMAPYDVCVALTKQANDLGLAAPALAEKVGIGVTSAKTYLRIGRAPEYIQQLLLRVEHSVRVVDVNGVPAVDRHGRPEMKIETLPALDIKKVERLTRLVETLQASDKRAAKVPGFKPMAERVALRLARRCALESWTVETLDARCEMALKAPDAEENAPEVARPESVAMVSTKTKLTIDTKRVASLDGAARAEFVTQLNAALSPLNLALKDVAGR